MPDSYSGTHLLPKLVSSGSLTSRSANGAFGAPSPLAVFWQPAYMEPCEPGAAPSRCTNGKKIDPVLLEAAIRVFGSEALAMHWLMTQASALADKRPVDATVEDVLELLSRLEHGFGA